MAWIVPVVSAVAGAYGAAKNASAANKGKNSWTDSTTTTSPYMSGAIQNDLEAALGYQRGIAQRGAPQVDSHGRVTYAPLPVGEAPSGTQMPQGWKPGDPITNGGLVPGGGGGGAKTIQSPSSASSSRSGKASTWTNARGETMTMGPGGKAVKASPGTPTPATGTPTTTPKSAADIFRQAAERGFEAGNTDTIKQGRNATAAILGAAGGGGPESTGFEGYNPVLDRLAGTLEGDVNSRKGRDLLLQFLEEDKRGGSGGGGTGGSSGGGNVRYGYAKGSPQAMAAAGYSNNSVPDSMKADSYFAEQTRKIMDEGANSAELEGLISAMNADTEKGMFRDLAQLDAASQGSGRFGGDMWKGMSLDAREEALQEMNKTASGVRMNDREARRQARLNALAGVNARDQALLNANVQREGINASSSAAAGASADQMALARRGQDLQALGALLDTENFSVGQLGDIGSQLSGDRLTAMGQIPGLEGVGLSGLQIALGGGGGLNDITQMQNQYKLGQAQIGVQRQGLNQQLGMFNAGQGQNTVDDYMRTLLGIGGMGGTQRTVGQNAIPGAGVSVGGSAVMGALGGGLAGYGAARGY